MSTRTQGTALILGVHFFPLFSLYCESFFSHSDFLTADKVLLLSEDNSSHSPVLHHIHQQEGPLDCPLIGEEESYG